MGGFPWAWYRRRRRSSPRRGHCASTGRRASSVRWRTGVPRLMHLAFMLVIIARLGGAAATAADLAIPVLDVAAVPYLTPADRARYGDFTLVNLSRALAV